MSSGMREMAPQLKSDGKVPYLIHSSGFQQICNSKIP